LGFAPERARRGRHWTCTDLPDGRRLELLRATRRGGRIGVASWTPEGFIGELFRVIGRFSAPAPGLRGGGPQGLALLVIAAVLAILMPRRKGSSDIAR
jgi:hypothetical protein